MELFYVFGFGFTAILSWISVLGFLFYTEPQSLGLSGLSLFYLAVFIGLFALFAFVEFAAKRIFYSGRRINFFTISFRRYAMISFIMVSGLLLQGIKVLSWPIMTGLVLSSIFLELYFLNNEKYYGKS